MTYALRSARLALRKQSVQDLFPRLRGNRRRPVWCLGFGLNSSHPAWPSSCSERFTRRRLYGTRTPDGDTIGWHYDLKFLAMNLVIIAADRPRAIPCLIHPSFLDRLVGCDTSATVRHTTPPILGQHTPKQFECLPVPLARGSLAGAAEPGRCDVAPDSTAQDRFAPAVPTSAHPGDHLLNKDLAAIRE
jgi:hypothetical protein